MIFKSLGYRVLLGVKLCLFFSYTYAQTDTTTTLVQTPDTLQKELASERISTGYFKQEKDLLTNSVAYVHIDSVQKKQNVDVLTAFEILYPGVTVDHNYESNTIKIFTNELSAITNVEPLYVVDGLPVSKIDFLSPDNIESIAIVKDALYPKLYGVFPVNGIVVINTKKGYADTGKKALHATCNSYWNSSNSHNHVLNLNGGSDRISVNTGISYNGTYGSGEGYEAERFSLHVNSEYILFQKRNRNILLLGENLTYNRSKRVIPANIPLYYSDPSLHIETKLSNDILGNIYMELQPLRNLLYSFSCGTRLINGDVNDLFSDVLVSSAADNQRIGYYKGYFNSLSYSFDIAEKHTIFTALSYNMHNEDNSGSFENTDYRYIIPSIYFDSFNIIDPSYTNDDRTTKNFFGQLNYNFNDRYILNFMIQREGRTSYGGDYMWGQFRSISGAWIVSNEKFMKNASGIYCRLHTSLKREELQSSVVGLDFNAFHNKLQTSVNWNYNNAGFYLSYGDIMKKNNALEVFLKYQNTKGNFSYSATGSLVYEKVEIAYTYDPKYGYIGGYSIPKSEQVYFDELFFGYKIDPNNPTYDSWEEINNSPLNRLYTVQPGDVKYVDINGDNLIDANDFGEIGSVRPDLVIGLQLHMSYRGIYLHVKGKGAFGHQVFNTNRYLSDVISDQTTYISSSYIEDGDFSLSKILLWAII